MKETETGKKGQKSTGTADKAKSKAVKKAADVDDVHLPGEENDQVPIFDTCDEVRRKINAHLRSDGTTKAQLVRGTYIW